MNDDSVRTDRTGDVQCGCCEKVVHFEDTAECACCRRRACLACVRRYGHYMQVCDDCRLDDW